MDYFKVEAALDAGIDEFKKMYEWRVESQDHATQVAWDAIDDALSRFRVGFLASLRGEK